MERKLATIRKISEVLPIENADAIELVKIDGWQCVAKIGEFKPGDECVYVEIDAMLPIRTEFEFLRKSCYKKMFDGTEGFRIRTVRLRGKISQGIAFPLSILGNRMAELAKDDIPLNGELALVVDHKEGDDLTEFLQIKKYEPYIPAQLMGEIKGPFPSFIPKTDEERCQNVPWVLEKYQGTEFYMSEKLDGSSCTIFINNGEFGICSRNLELKETADNSFWKVAREMKIEDKLRTIGRNIAIQGELVGEGIQKNPYKLKGQMIFFYNAYDINTGKYMNKYHFDDFMHAVTLLTVPILAESYSLPKTIEELLLIADGKSILNPQHNREGIVLRPLVEVFDPDMPCGGRLSFKVISNKYLLKNED